MKSYLALAWKELKAQKITAILILVAVIMSTIMTTVIGQSIGILQSMRIQQAAGLNGNRYATFHQLGKEQAQKLHEDDRLYDVGDTIFIGSTPLGNSSLSLDLPSFSTNRTKCSVFFDAFCDRDFQNVVDYQPSRQQDQNTHQNTRRSHK